MADQLRAEINRHQAESRIGSEVCLQRRFSVGKATLRTAIRQLEGEGIVRIRRGAGGGLYGLPGATNAAASDLSNYLIIADAKVEDIASWSMRLYQLAAMRAAENATANARTHVAMALTRLEGTCHKVAQYAPAWSNLRNQIVRAARDPAVELLHRALYSTYLDVMYFELRLGRYESTDCAGMTQVESALASAIFGKSVDQVKSLSDEVLGLECQTLDRSIKLGLLPGTARPSRAFLIQNADRKLAHHVARMMLRQISLAAPNETRLGNIEELSDRYGVCTEILREAIAMIQAKKLVVVKRGRNGGVFIDDIHISRLIDGVINLEIYKNSEYFRNIMCMIDRDDDIWSNEVGRMIFNICSSTQSNI